MKCKCGATTRVIWSGRVLMGDDDSMRRRRSCEACGIRFSTAEIIIPGSEVDGAKAVTLKTQRKPKNKPPKMNREQVKASAQARRRLEEVRDEEYEEEIDAVIRRGDLRGLANL
jgi:transcriptional regulator NrdR family protein